mgnify:CR=1 FL=1|tara:strand:- start:112440 stop:113585 length:1146 start_codon:yes stop_codon:yes gene_type:complete
MTQQAPKALTDAAIHDGTTLHADAALLLPGDGTAQIIPVADLPGGVAQQALAGGIIAPGFVDLQLNGGGGVMFNDDQSVDTLRRMAEAHARIGTAALMPTLITDTPAHSRAAIAAVEQAIAARVPGIIGIHLEGPHLSVSRKGAHSADLIRPLDDDDLTLYLDAAQRLPHVMLTLAPENATPAQIKVLAQAGVIVSLGHTNASYDICMASFDAGARCVTHLFNAMSQMGNRAPGLVGAALHHGGVHCGLIADGIHVHPASMATAFAAEQGNPRIFLVTDAMATAGSDISNFTLNGREVQRRDARLTLADGTLAGADLELAGAIGYLIRELGHDPQSAVARATSLPAAVLGDNSGWGRFSGRVDGMIHIDATCSGVVPISAL